ncbi:MAG: DnaJ C-terminal domain-containing protein [Pseudomonadota bacterium]
MEYKDYYKILGVARDASQDEIKRAYRKLARKYHPDVSKEANAETRFKEINEANEVLKDAEKRAAYDQLGSRWQAGEQFRPPPGWDAGFEFNGAPNQGAQGQDFSDFFSELFGRRARHGGSAQQRPGKDHHAKIMLELEDAYRGGSHRISLRVPEIDASGHLAYRERSLNVQMPKGVRAGQQVRLAGQGTPGAGGAGDLYLEVQFRPHPLYRVDDSDIYLKLPVTPWEAALGATIKAPTPGGTVEVKVPPNSQSGRKLRLKGRGLPGNPAGDLYLTLEVVLPEATTARARELYQTMAQELAFDPRHALGV